ncbi:MAG: sulfite exporter TauE/SafE family protein [Planctomycetes bacterium]|nr:sulfite exporter TauE/SafE family protein [Planctomycetota bacterium]
MSAHDPDLDATAAAEERAERSPQGFGVAAMGFAISAWCGMCGIGGGLFAVPVLHFVYKLDLKRAIPVSLSLVAAGTISGTIAEALRADSALRWGIVAGLVVGSLFGAPLGFQVAKRIDSRKLKLVFAVLLAFVGSRILGFVPQAMAAGPDGVPVFEPSWSDYGLAAVIGLGGGFVAPLLGIGGGLIAVPALLFALPGIGHLGARACSLAMATVTSTRSLALYWRAGQLDLRGSASFALGAVVGAVAGVRLVHIPGVEDVAEKMLGVTLLLVCLRFVLDLRKRPAEG